jgi:hypothetical protein
MRRRLFRPLVKPAHLIDTQPRGGQQRVGMQQLASSDLKTILHSKRANLYYLEHCRVLVNGGRVEYVTDEGKHSLYWNIPIANTTTVVLGTGTSVTQAAMRELAKAGVLVGFLRWRRHALVQRQRGRYRSRLVLAAKRVPPHRIPAGLGAVLVPR